MAEDFDVLLEDFTAALFGLVEPLECAAADAAIDDYGEHPNHHAFVDYLRERHGRKQGFWSRAQ